MSVDYRKEVITKLTAALEAGRISIVADRPGASAVCRCQNFRFFLFYKSVFGPYELHIEECHDDGSYKGHLAVLNEPSLQEELGKLFELLARFEKTSTCQMILEAIP